MYLFAWIPEPSKLSFAHCKVENGNISTQSSPWLLVNSSLVGQYCNLNYEFLMSKADLFLMYCAPYAAVVAIVVEATNKLHQKKGNSQIMILWIGELKIQMCKWCLPLESPQVCNVRLSFLGSKLGLKKSSSNQNQLEHRIYLSSFVLIRKVFY